ncbi:hypothetical protein GGI21_003448, partial [Coemansia aciculifera]
MAKRGGDISVECESSERKRLRNEGSGPMEWEALTLVAEDKRCVEAMVDMLQRHQFEPMPRCMDVAVHLVQGLKQLQLLNTPYARQSFEHLYGSILAYVGNVIDKLKQLRGKDGYAAVSDSSRVTIDDPPQLLDVVSSAVGYLACARAGSLQLKHAGLKEGIAVKVLRDMSARDDSSGDGRGSFPSSALSLHCAVCDHCPNEQAGDSTPIPISGWLSYWFIASSKQNEATSISFLRGVCRFVRHAPPEDIGLKSSPLGQGTVRRLTSSSREVRLAATDAILAYSQACSPDSEATAEIKRTNRAETMRTVARLAQDIQEPGIIEETLQLVAGGIGCACELQEDTLGVILPFLLDYYCRDNIFLRAVAMEQLLAIAHAHGISLARLLSAFSGSISCTLASTLAQRSPRSFAHCMQILEVTPKEFLRQHQDAILSHLVASGNEAALRHVAEILDVQLPVLCVNQAPVVFVRIFLMDDQLMHQAMLRFVRLISVGSGMDADQVEVNIPSLLRSCSVKLIFNLILSLGEEDGVLRRRA